jgi:excisionase family DNA binding protein
VTDSLLTPEDTADQLSCGRTTVYGLMAAGELKSVKIGRSRRIPASAVAEYIERLKGQAVA